MTTTIATSRTSTSTPRGTPPVAGNAGCGTAAVHRSGTPPAPEGGRSHAIRHARNRWSGLVVERSPPSSSCAARGRAARSPPPRRARRLVLAEPSARPRRCAARPRSRPASRPSGSGGARAGAGRPARADRPARGARAQREKEVDAKLDRARRARAGRRRPRDPHAGSSRRSSRRRAARELAELQRISGLTVDEAKQHLLERSEELVRHELARRVRQLEEEARAEAKRRARNLVADALQRVAASHAAETTVSLVELPSDDMKGRIIGREGRNIRALEHLTGVDFIIDDTPQAVVLSSFDGRPPRGRAAHAGEADRGRPHPPGPDRGDVLPVEGRARGARSGRPASRRSSRRTAARCTRSS